MTTARAAIRTMLTHQIRDAYYRQNECLTIVTGFCMVAASIPEGSSAMEDLVSLFTPFAQKQDGWTDADKRALVDAIRLYYQRRAPDAHVAPLAVAARPVLARRGGGWVRKALQGLLTLVLAAGCVALLMWGAMHLLDQPVKAEAPVVISQECRKMYRMQTRLHTSHAGEGQLPLQLQNRSTLLSRLAEMNMLKNPVTPGETKKETTGSDDSFWATTSLIYHSAKWVAISASVLTMTIVVHAVVQFRNELYSL
jgi:hypothetical protein